MCVIAAVQAGKTVSRQHFQFAAENNSDGFGLAHVTPAGIIELFKTMDYAEFEQAYYDRSAADPESPFILHFRIATHGSVDTYNVHPFRISDNLVVAHNGVIPGMLKDDDDDVRSDTQLFVDDYLKNLPDGFIENNTIMELIRSYIGSHNKLAFMDSSGQVSIVNAAAGTVEDDIWWSNTSFKYGRPSRAVRTSSSTPGVVDATAGFRHGSGDNRPYYSTNTVSNRDTTTVDDDDWTGSVIPAQDRSRFVIHALSGEFYIPSCRLCQHYGECICECPPGQGQVSLPEGLTCDSYKLHEALLPVAGIFKWNPHYHSRARQERKCTVCRAVRASGKSIPSLLDTALNPSPMTTKELEEELFGSGSRSEIADRPM